MPQRDYQRLGGWLFVLYRYSELRLGNERDLSLQILTSGVQLDPVGTTLTVACMVAQGALIYQVVGRRPSYWQVLIVLVVLLTILDLFTSDAHGRSGCFCTDRFSGYSSQCDLAFVFSALPAGRCLFREKQWL